MPSFSYKARDNKGLLVNGSIESESEATALLNLNDLGCQVVSLSRQQSFRKDIFKALEKWRKVPLQEIILFARQLAVMLRAGLPMITALSSISQQVRHEELKKAVEGLLKAIRGGRALSEALSEYPKIFNELFVNMIKVGETAGILDQVLDRIVILNTQEYEVRARVQAAFIYPTILVVAAIAVVSFLLVAIIPKFVVIFDTYETTIPFATQILLSASNFLSKFWYVFIFVIVGFTGWFKKYITHEKNQYNFHSALLKIPFLGDFYLKIIIARFTRTLGVLMKSGVSILEALTVAGNAVNNVVISRMVVNVRQAVVGGQVLSKQIEISGIFPPMVIQMISAGEKSGKLDQMLSEVASYYDQEIEYALKNFATILEPVLLLAMGGMVGFIALAVLLPIFNLVKVFQGGL